MNRLFFSSLFALAAYVVVSGSGKRVEAADAGEISQAVANVDANSSKYLPRDGRTYCNWFVSDVATELGLGEEAIPRYSTERRPDRPENKPYSANHLHRYFTKESTRANGKWKKVSKEDAISLSKRGEFVVASKSKPEGHGHIAIVMPSSSQGSVRIAQAGAKNGNNMTLRDGFGRHTPDFFVFKAN